MPQTIHPTHTNVPVDMSSTQWKGYTLDEIRYARAFTAARMQINQERLAQRYRQISRQGFIPATKSGIIAKVIGAFSYLDMAVIAWKIGSQIFRFARAFRK